MRPYKIFSDSSCDTPTQLLEEHDITLIPFYVSFDKENYFKEIIEMPIATFYERLTSEQVFPKTSLPSVQDYIEFFKAELDKGNDVLCLCLSANFSGSYQSAVTAKNILEEDYNDSKIHIVNSISATSGQGLTLLQAVYMKESGFTIEETVAKLEELKNTSRIMFTVGTLEYLQKGGRIGKAASLAGTMLNLKPLIQLKDGELIPYGTIRGRNKSLDKVISMTKEYFNEINASYDDYDFCITTGTSIEEANKLKAMVEDLIGKTINYPIFTIGVTIGTNTGPDALGCCFIKKFNVIK